MGQPAPTLAPEGDGINGDTMDGVGEEWWQEGRRRGLEVALEPEVFYGDFSYLQVAA